jgi:ribosomal protein S18
MDHLKGKVFVQYLSRLTESIKRARYLALVPYTDLHTNIR